MATNKDAEILRASEVGQYVYCARAWWLGQVKGYRPTNEAAMQQGSQQHEAHGRAVAGYHRLRQVGWVLLAVGVLIIAAILLGVVR